MNIFIRFLAVPVVAFSFAFNAYALGGFGSLSAPQQKVINQIVEQLGVENPSSKIKMQIYDNIEYVFESNWNSYWLGLNELKLSKYKNGKEKGVVEFVFNNESNGTIFISFVYKPDVDQVIIFKRQIRHGSKKGLLSIYEERKNDKKFKVVHETDSYAMLEKKGKVSFQLYHVGENTSSLVYYQQNVVNVD